MPGERNIVYMDYSQSKKYLESFIDYEKISDFSYSGNIKLERVKFLFRDLRLDLSKLKAVHIAGTKGKGSTAAFISFLLAKSGLKVGLYTSPHLNDFRERIQIIKSIKDKIRPKLISKREVASLVEDMKPVLERSRAPEKEEAISFFEAYTALAFKYFLNEKVDFAVLECGLGGRLDATNVISPKVSIITSISHDHTGQLGTTLEKIAGEKAGIIKKRIPVVAAGGKKRVLAVLGERARRCNSKLYIYNKDFLPSKVRVGFDQSSFSFSSFLGRYDNLNIKLKGKHQIENACLAIFCFQLLKKKYSLTLESIYSGLKAAFIPGRFQVLVYKDRDFLLDIAHNYLSIKALNRAVKLYFSYRRIILIFGCSYDKDTKKMLRTIDFYNIILTKAKHPRAKPPGEIKRVSGLKSCSIESDSRRALKTALKISEKDDLIVITGSVFLVAEVSRLIKDEA